MRPELAGEFGQELIHGDRRTADELLEQAVDIAAFALDVVGLEIKERVGLPFEHAPIEQGLALHLGRNIHVLNVAAGVLRSEERRVGKECRSRWSPDHEKKKEMYSEKIERSTERCT